MRCPALPLWSERCLPAPTVIGHWRSVQRNSPAHAPGSHPSTASETRALRAPRSTSWAVVPVAVCRPTLTGRAVRKQSLAGGLGLRRPGQTAEGPRRQEAGRTMAAVARAGPVACGATADPCRHQHRCCGSSPLSSATGGAIQLSPPPDGLVPPPDRSWSPRRHPLPHQLPSRAAPQSPLHRRGAFSSPSRGVRYADPFNYRAGVEPPLPPTYCGFCIVYCNARLPTLSTSVTCARDALHFAERGAAIRAVTRLSNPEYLASLFDAMAQVEPRRYFWVVPIGSHPQYV